ncbi:hypothetical protein N658DRAFT_417734 [Parathielavia hyrcaniae]|uniref:Uncharacterized protein n=1 Tax=Parathielavia hyrcaniae TaxID=113614 RepID=A0AAN6Q8K7_9PEZI|nr:hypothetical protein N658DRAFT_417734 [Parathielavia hyrcaniae]
MYHHTLDRSGFFDGGSDDSSCEDPPSPHSSSGGLSPVETASSSAPSADDCLDLFDWDRFEIDQATDVTIPSNVPSEGKPVARVPIHVSAAAAASHGDDCPMPDAPPQDPPLPHVWPEVSGPHPPRHQNIHLEASPSPPPSTAMQLDGPPQATSPSTQKKTRVVKNPEETSLVRDVGACISCRMNRIKVSGRLNLRVLTPPSDWPGQFRWSCSDPNLIIPSREQFTKGRTELVYVSISDHTDSPSLEVEVALLKSQGLPGGPRWCIASGRHPSEDAIYRWMREQIEADTRADFEAEMDKLLLELVRRQEEGMPLPGQHAGSPYQGTQLPASLLPNLLKMKSMYKIWSCKQLFARQGGPPPLPFDLRLASVQEVLRYLAAQRISELERNILPELEKYCSSKEKSSARSKKEKDTPSAVRPGMDVMRWFLSWQMILIYRQSLGWVLDQQQQTDAAPVPIAGESAPRQVRLPAC